MPSGTVPNTLDENQANPQNSQTPRMRSEETDVQRSEEARRRKFEEDKARKDKKAISPWPAEAWDAARAGKGPPEPWFPIIVNDSMTPEKVQQICGLSSPPKVEWLTTAPFETEGTQKPERLQYCAVQGRKASNTLIEATHGTSVVIWFEGERRAAWSASEKSPDDEIDTSSVNENEGAERAEQNGSSEC